MAKAAQSATANKTGLEWLRARMEKLGYNSLEEVAQEIQINRGNLYRYLGPNDRL